MKSGGTPQASSYTLSLNSTGELYDTESQSKIELQVWVLPCRQGTSDPAGAASSGHSRLANSSLRPQPRVVAASHSGSLPPIQISPMPVHLRRDERQQ